MDSIRFTLKDVRVVRVGEIGCRTVTVEDATPEQQIRSRTCPLERSRKSIKSCNPKLSKSDVKSFV